MVALQILLTWLYYSSTAGSLRIVYAMPAWTGAPVRRNGWQASVIVDVGGSVVRW